MSAEIPMLHRNERFSLSRKAAALALAVPLALNLSGCSDAESRGFVFGPKSVHGQSCEFIPEASIDAAEDIYADSWEPQRKYLDNEVEDALRFSTAERLVTAGVLGLTIYDYEKEYSDVIQDDSSAGASEGVRELPVETYYAQAQDFMSRYGIELVFSDSIDLSDTQEVDDVDHVPYSYEQMVSDNDDATKQVLVNLIRKFGVLPVELVEEMGVKRIILSNIEKEGISGYVSRYDHDFDTFFLEARMGGGTIPIHEMFHVWDMRVCGIAGMSRDEQFDALNPVTANGADSVYENSDGFYSKGQADAIKQSDGLLAELQYAQTEEEVAAIQAEIDRIEAKIITVSDYSFTHMHEDKAELGAILLSQAGRWTMEDPDSPVLQQKATLLMARLYEASPMLVEFLARTSEASLNETNVLAD